MNTTITRRDLLKFTGGGVLGILFSPLPWKLLDDSAIWTQNWSLTPKLSHGPLTTLTTRCTFCDAGCGVTARCVDGMPFALSGMKNDPLSAGTLCPRGMTNHHMAYHPLRIVHAHRFTGKSAESRLTAISLDEAYGMIAKRITNGTGMLAILDQQPNRAVSDAYRQFVMARKNALVLHSPVREDATAEMIASILGLRTGSVGMDLQNCRLLISFGAPVLDGWGSTGVMNQLKRNGALTIVQFDARHSRTAQQADQWIAINPGTETLVALSLAHAVASLRPVAKNTHYNSEMMPLLSRFPAASTEATTGVPATVMLALAQKIAANTATIVLGAADPGGGPLNADAQKAIALVNIAAGSVGTSGGYVEKKERPGTLETAAMDWNTVPDRSISTLIVDGAENGYAIPWNVIEKKLTPEHFVVSLSPVLNEISAHADILLPSPSPFELLSDVTGPAMNAVSHYALATPILKPSPETIDPFDVIRELAVRTSTPVVVPTRDEAITHRCDQIVGTKRGTVTVNGTKHPVSEYADAAALMAVLKDSGVWNDEPVERPSKYTMTLPALAMKEMPAKATGLQLHVHGWRGATSASSVSPVMSKVFQEMELRQTAEMVRMAPETARANGLQHGDWATLRTVNGAKTVNVRFDHSVPAGIIDAAIAPLPNGEETPLHPNGTNISSLCVPTENGRWDLTPATITKG